ncbi:MAG: T9SS type A sorting domain-containing protein [Burkholderiales bacterium]|nr:T9SS type A sorting domain-containing protein [Bacteroidia bacterium]
MYSNTELQDLRSMANECVVKGWYVTQSRNILNAISGYLRDYADNCENTKVSSRMANETKILATVIDPKRSFTLFPNPNNGNMTMIYDLGKDTKANMNLYDVTGKLINTYDLQNTNGAIEINEAQLHNGIYFYCILVNGIMINTNKLIIIK